MRLAAALSSTSRTLIRARSKRAFAQTSEVKDADGGAEFAAANKFVVQEVDGFGRRLDGI
jgi:hypothetical protein